MTGNFEAACAWHAKGYNVVPQKAVDKKHPAVKWKDLQRRPVTVAELAQWQPMFANGVGFITGAISGVIVIETDGLAGETVLGEFEYEHGPLPETLVVRSGSRRGFHRHFKHPGVTVKTTANEGIEVDIRGDGGFCVLPPSRHKAGGQYEVVHDAEPAELPEGLLEFIETKAAEASSTSSKSGNKGQTGNEFSGLTPDVGADELGSNIQTANFTLPPVAEMRAMLKHLVEHGAFAERKEDGKDAGGGLIKVGWIKCGMALKAAYGDKVGFDLWGITHRDDTARNDAPAQWASFAAEAQVGHVTIGTIILAAKDTDFPARNLKADATEPGFVSYGPFTMDADNGLTKTVVRGEGKRHVEQVPISAAFQVLGRRRDPSGKEWGKQLRFHDADKRAHICHVSDAALQGDPGVLCAALSSEGLFINRAMQKGLAEYLAGVDVKARVTVVRRTGWHEIEGKHVFALPAETIGASADAPVVIDAVALGPYGVRGSLDDWKQGVGILISGHALPVFMVSAALAGPLANFLGVEGGGVHVYGGTSIGKSASLQAAASLWGRGDTEGYVRSWRATANGLEGSAASATDTCLILDELGVGEARDVAASIYSLANGQGKARAARDGSLREPKSWRVTILSSGELPLETKLSEDWGRKARGGQLVRLLDIPADRRLGHGVFDHAGSFGDAGKLADAIKSAAVAAYGTAGPELIRRIIARGVESVAATGRIFIQKFADQYVGAETSEQVVRAAKKFALIAFAGELATTVGVAPWARGEARRAAGETFNRWLEHRGGAGSHEERQAVEQVRLMIEQHGASRFAHADYYGAADEGKVRDRLGWFKGDGATREWWVPPEIWKAEVSAGLDHAFVARTLHKCGMLRRQDPKNLTCVVKLGGRTARVYVLTAAILASGP